MLAVVGLFFICKNFLFITTFPSAHLYFFMCSVIGVIVSFLFIKITQYYTDYTYEPVRGIARSS